MIPTPPAPAAALVAVALLGGCDAGPAPPDGSLHIALAISGRVRDPAAVFAASQDARHRCIPPARLRIVTAAGPAPPPEAPANHVQGYEVAFGPDYLPPPPGAGRLEPEWIGYGPQRRFSLIVPALPGQETTAGPVLLGRAFRITVSAGDQLWERNVTQDDPPSAGEVTIAPDGMSGRFRVPGLELLLPHGRMPPEEAIDVTGRWRCPAG